MHLLLPLLLICAFHSGLQHPKKDAQPKLVFGIAHDSLMGWVAKYPGLGVIEVTPKGWRQLVGPLGDSLRGFAFTKYSIGGQGGGAFAFYPVDQQSMRSLWIKSIFQNADACESYFEITRLTFAADHPEAKTRIIETDSSTIATWDLDNYQFKFELLSEYNVVVQSFTRFQDTSLMRKVYEGMYAVPDGGYPVDDLD